MVTECTLRIQLALQLVVIFFSQVAHYLLFFLNLIFNSSFKGLGGAVLTMCWRWPGSFSRWIISLEAIQCNWLCSRIEGFDLHPLLFLFPHLPNVKQSVLNPLIVCASWWVINLRHIPDLAHLLHESLLFLLLGILRILLLLLKQPVLHAGALVSTHFWTSYLAFVGLFHEWVFLLLPLVEDMLAHLLTLGLVDLAHGNEAVTHWTVIQKVLVVLGGGHRVLMLLLLLVEIRVDVLRLALVFICLMLGGDLGLRADESVVLSGPWRPLELKDLLV